MGNVKKYFASAVTGEGFVNFFNSINFDNTQFQYILKGGAGTGKSTLMKKVGAHFEKIGMAVEYFYCSSDPKSLDGVRIVDKGISIVDGTAPHVIEAYLPGVTHKIINLGEYIFDGVKAHEAEIINLLRKKEKCYSIAYKYQESALKLFEINLLIDKNINLSSVNKMLKLAKNIVKNNKINEKITKNSKKFAKNRKLFIDSLDNNVNFIKNNFPQITEINLPAADGQIFFKTFVSWLNKRGYNTVSVQNSLKSSIIDGVFVEEIGQYFQLNLTCSRKVQKAVADNNQLIHSLQDLAARQIKKAIYYHKRIEKIYYDYINFKALDWQTEQLIQL